MTDLDIYFAGSIRGGRSDASLYATLIAHLEHHGTVLTEHVGVESVEQREQTAGVSDGEIHDQDMAWLRQADIVVAEVTTPSLGVGYELGRAVERDKPTLCLYRPDGDHDLSAMVRGSDTIRVVEYHQPDDVTEVFEQFIEHNRP